MRPAALTAAILFAVPLQAQSADPRITALIESISAERLAATVQALEGFGTRNTLSDTVSSTRGIGAARRWIAAQFQQASPELQVTFDRHVVPPAGRITREVVLQNVMAVLPGRSPRRIYVSGHYDTVVLRRADGPAGGATEDRDNQPAPGANDDGSGTALVIELARVFAQSEMEFDATLVFIALAGEEQGLVGARQHATKAAAERWTIDAVFNNDIVGGSVGGNGRTDSRTVRVFSEGPEDSPSRQLARYIREAAARYVPAHTVRLISRHDRFGRGGDHTAFNQQGFAGVRFTEANENYSRQHTVEDTFTGVDPAYLARNAQVNAAAMASLALAPAAPVVTGERGPTLGRGQGGYDAVLRWRPSAGASAYRVVWREAWTPDWQFSRVVQDTTVVLPGVSIDDYVFGVAAIGAGGHESVVAPYVLAPRR
ncbi:MAG TPA: M20/M25/M40 family metallo-hydrolase [Gemmatimonadales bacterium]|nr:M20/M25/M40 family metallo-hydrolase [Gemmatimonadales bacterium]